MDSTIRAIAKQCSQPKPRISELALRELRPYVESFLDRGWLKAQLANYEQWAARNSDPLLQRSLLHRPLGFSKLVAAIWAARSWEEIHRDDPSFRPAGGPKWLLNIACSLAVLELHAGTQLDRDAREHIQQRLQAADQLWGIIHECNTFAYFIQKGVVVEPHFLKKASQQEIIIRWKGQEVPVQCKCKRPGAGRLIPQDTFVTLAGCIARDVKRASRRVLVRIGSTGPIRQADIGFLRTHVLHRVGTASGPDIVVNQVRAFTIRTQPLSGQFTQGSIRNYLRGFNFHTGLVIGEPGNSQGDYNVDMVIGIDANPDESRRSWLSLYDSIENGAKQLRGGPPGIIAVYYADPVNDFETLRPGQEPMRVVIGKMLESCPHVGAVILSSESDLQLPGEGGPGRTRIYYGKEWRFPIDFPLGEPI